MPSATRRMPSWTFERVFSLMARMVPRISAVSGITLYAVPAWMRPTVTTDGSNTSTLRVTIVCSACTISHATGIGSRVWCGWLAWPPLPRTVIVIESLDAMIGPCRVLTIPTGNCEVMCSANACWTGDSVPSGRAGRSIEETLLQHELRARVPSSPGWNMNSTRPAIRSRCRERNRADAASIAVCVS